MSDAATITNIVVTGAGDERNLFRERQCRVKYETEILGRQAGHYRFGGRQGEREGLTILEVCCGRSMKRNSVLKGLRVR